MTVKDDIVAYLASAHGVDSAEVEGDTPLFSSGLVDSFAMIDLVAWIETRTGARMRAADITLDNLDTVNRVLAYLETQAGAAA